MANQPSGVPLWRPAGSAPKFSVLCIMVVGALVGLSGLVCAETDKEAMAVRDMNNLDKKIGPCPPGPYTPPTGFPKPLPRVQVDLAVAPRDRWNKVIDMAYEEHGWDYTFGNTRRYFDAVFPLLERPLIEEISQVAQKSLQKDLLEELEGALDRVNIYQPAGQKNFTLDDMLALNVLYELTAGCTSVVAADGNASMWHGRTLDWPLPPDVRFTNFTYLVEWVNSTQGNAVVFRGVHYVGIVGANTGMKPGAWSVSLDERHLPNRSRTLIENIYNMDYNHAVPVTWLMREALMNNQTFKTAAQTLSGARIAAPAYYIMAGTSDPQGVVLTRSWNESDVWLIPNGPTPWYLVQTNYDHWDPVPPVDNRRGLAEQALNTIGQSGVGVSGLQYVLGRQGNATTRGVLNANTIFSVIMNPSSDTIEGWLWQ